VGWKKRKKKLSFKRREAIKCLNIKKKNFVSKTMVGKEIKEISLDPCHTKQTRKAQSSLKGS